MLLRACRGRRVRRHCAGVFLGCKPRGSEKGPRYAKRTEAPLHTAPQAPRPPLRAPRGQETDVRPSAPHWGRGGGRCRGQARGHAQRNSEQSKMGAQSHGDTRQGPEPAQERSTAPAEVTHPTSKRPKPGPCDDRRKQPHRSSENASRQTRTPPCACPSGREHTPDGCGRCRDAVSVTNSWHTLFSR